MGITLHKTLGVNPHMTSCYRCGADGKELVLIGNKTSIVKCPACETVCYGGKPTFGRCLSCGVQSQNWERVGTIGEHDRIPSLGLCDACEEELATHKEVVANGGIHWKCDNCDATGVIKKCDFADAVREQHKLTNGEPCGVEFTKEECPACSSN